MIRIAAMPGMTRQQRGSTLIVALIMLALLTLIAISAMKSTTSSIQVVGNAQFREEAKAVAQKAMENLLSNKIQNTEPPQQNMDVNGDGTPDYTVTFAKPKCRSSRKIAVDDPEFPPSCVTAVGAADLCYWAVLDIQAIVTDNRTGATVTLHQGIRTVSDGDVLNMGC